MNLEEVLMEDLLIEIMKRHHACIIVGLQKDYERPNSTSTTVRWSGYPEICVGLAQKISWMIINQELNKSVGIEPVNNKDA